MEHPHECTRVHLCPCALKGTIYLGSGHCTDALLRCRCLVCVRMPVGALARCQLASWLARQAPFFGNQWAARCNIGCAVMRAHTCFARLSSVEHSPSTGLPQLEKARHPSCCAGLHLKGWLIASHWRRACSLQAPFVAHWRPLLHTGALCCTLAAFVAHWRPLLHTGGLCCTLAASFALLLAAQAWNSHTSTWLQPCYRLVAAITPLVV